jgi:hypothetical protein
LCDGEISKLRQGECYSKWYDEERLWYDTEKITSRVLVFQTVTRRMTVHEHNPKITEHTVTLCLTKTTGNLVTRTDEEGNNTQGIESKTECT